MAFNRNKFKGADVSALKKQQEELNAKQPKRGGGGAGFLRLEEGKNRVRVYPGHPDKKTDFFTFPRKTHFLPIEVTYQKDGKEVVEIKPKPIFNSIIHGGTAKDLIDEYLSFARKVANEEIEDDGERKAFLKPLEDFKGGIKGQTKWVVYADLTTPDGKTQFGRLDLPTSVKDAMNVIAMAEDDPEEVISTDPFTDPDDGRAVFIEYDKQATVPQNKRDPKKYYTTALDWKKPAPLTDKQLEDLMEQKALEDIFYQSYTRKDFDFAMEGLQRIDVQMNKDKDGDTFQYNLFEYDEFIEIVEEIDAYYAEIEDGDEDEDPKPAKKAEKKKAAPVEEEEEEESDMPWEKSLDEMARSELKGVVKREDVDIRITKATSDDDIRDAITDHRGDEPASTDSAEEEVEEEEEEAPVEKSSRKRRKAGGSSRMDELEED